MTTLNLTSASLGRVLAGEKAQSIRRFLASEKTQKAIDVAIWVAVIATVATVAVATSVTSTNTQSITTPATVGGATEVGSLAGWIKGMTEGTMGSVFALGTLAVGLATGIVKQTLMPVAVAVGMAATAKWGPSVLLGITSTVL